MTFEQKLGIAGLVASLATPVALMVIGYALNRRLRRIETIAQRERRLSETRLDLYKEIGFQLNDLYAYFMRFGSWKELTAADAIARKRSLDRHVYTYRPLFSAEFFALYQAFMAETFRMHCGPGTDAMLRTSADHRREAGTAELESRFTGEDNRDPIWAAHAAIMDRLATELGVESAFRTEPANPG